VNFTSTLLLNQPCPLAARGEPSALTVAPEIVGGVLSTLTPTVCLIDSLSSTLPARSTLQKVMVCSPVLSCSVKGWPYVRCARPSIE
jgi:hypothetical protein